MSIVNQILKDLEKRTASKNPDVKKNSLPFSRPARRIKKFRWMLLLLVLAACMLLALDVFVIAKHFARKGSAQMSATQQQTVSAPKVPDSSGSDIPVSAALSGMTVEVQGAVTQLRFLLSKPVLYRMATNTGGTVYRVIFDNTRPKADIPQLDYTDTAVRSLKMSSRTDGSLEVLFFLRKGVKLQQAGIFPGKSSEFMMNLVYLSPQPQQQSFLTTPQPIPPVLSTPHGGDFSAGSLQMAMKLASVGEVDKAGALLKSLLDITPEFHPAREALVKLLMQHSRITEAGMVLQKGLGRYPQWLPYIDLEARWLSAQGKIHSALHVLSQHSPTLEMYPEYYALMAGLYQKENQPQMAAKLYQQLIAFQPDHGRWWLGYAIALDGMDRHAEAVSAYMRALRVNGEGLSPELKAWAETRLQSSG